MQILRCIIVTSLLISISGYNNIPTIALSKRLLHRHFSNPDEFGDNSIFPKSPLQNEKKQYAKNFIQACVFSISYSGLLKNSYASNNNGNANKPCVAVIGSGGKTGKLIVKTLSHDLGVSVRPIYRDNKLQYENLPEIESPRFADVTKLETLNNALEGASSVIFAASASKKGGNAESVDYLGVINAAKACISLNIPKLVVISSAAITKPNSLGYKFTNIFGNIMDYKLKGELGLQSEYSALSADSPLSYVIIRPGGLVDGDASGVGEIELNQGDTIAGEIARADVAQCAAFAAISQVIPRNVVFELYKSGTGGPLEGRFPKVSGLERNGKILGGGYDNLFSGLKQGINGL